MNKLREVRVVRRISQMQLRLLTGVNQTKISWIENGYIKPKPEEKEKLSRALGLPVEAVFPSAKDSE